ncbi:MAG TPA: thioesterase family protein [Chloroflexota bacterium]|nr:thioesterase family protein [Chloroflexota bacterium]
MPMREDSRRLWPISLPIEIKGYDIDAWGIVSNIVYVRWLEDLRTALLWSLVDWQQCYREGHGPVLARTEIDYRRPLRLGDPLVGHMWVAGAGRSRWQVGAEFVVDGRVAAAARQEGYWVDLRTVRPVPLPAALRARLAAEGVTVGGATAG